MDDILNRTTLTDLIGFIDKEHGSHSKSIVNFAIVLDVLTIVLNSFLICTILSERKLKQQSAYLQVINTCIANILSGLFIIPLSIYSELEIWNLGQLLCHSWITMDVYLPFVNVLIFVFLNVERIVLISTNRYSKCSNIFIVIELLAPWVIGILIIFPIWIEGAITTPDDLGICLVHLNQDAALLSPIMTFFIPSWICIILTAAILIRNFRNDTPNAIDRTIVNPGSTSSRIVCLNKDSVSMVGLCFANYIYLTLWFPHQFISALLVFCEQCYPPYHVLVGITWLGALTSMICPISWFTDANIRSATKHLLLSCKCKRTHSALSNIDSNEIELLDNCERSTSL